jgi:hypothetical protein
LGDLVPVKMKALIVTADPNGSGAGGARNSPIGQAST